MTFRRLIIIGLTFLTLSPPSSVFADSDTQNLKAGYGTSKDAQKALFAGPSDLLIIPEGLAQSLYLPTPTNPLAIQQTQSGLATFFALNPNADSADAVANNIKANSTNFGDSTATPPTTASLYAGCSISLITGGAAGLTKCLEAKQTQPFTNVDINSLLGPLVYQDGQDAAASNFISSITSLNNPFTPLDLNTLLTSDITTIPALINANPNVKQYLSDLRAFAALQSVGLSNLNQFYAERTPTKIDPDKNADLAQALKDIGMPNASQLQVENYMATRRLADPKWVTSLQDDTPSALLRQIVVLLAQNLAESYNNRMATERLTATMSVLTLQQAALARTQAQQDISTITSAQQQAPAPASTTPQ